MDCMTPNRTPYTEPLSAQDDTMSMYSLSPSRPRSPRRLSSRASIGLKTREAPSSAFYNPDNWRKEYATISRDIVRSAENIRLFRDTDTQLLLKQERRAACCVRTMPSLDAIKDELKSISLSNRAQMYDVLESCPSELRGSALYAKGDGEGGRRSTLLKKQRRSKSRRRSPSPANPAAEPSPVVGSSARATAVSFHAKNYLPNPTIWAVGGINQNEITVYDSVTGRRMLRIRDPKMNVPVMTLRHAPFRGFMDRHADVIPIRKPADILRLKSSQLVETDYVWVGFADGTIRLFPANVGRIRESDRAFQFSKGDLVDLVFELPKYHAAAILSIVRSPCHQDDEGFNAATANRLSSAVEYMSASSMIREGQDREHLSLMCTASVDSSIAIWDVRKIYQTLEKMRQQRREALQNPMGTLHTASGESNMNNDIITMDGFNPVFSVRSACMLVKARPLMKLKGGVVGMRTLQWVSSLVMTEGYQPPREVSELTRDAEEQSAPQLVKQRQPVQVATRFDRREESRRSLRLSEHDMRDVEKQLDEMLPPLAEEPPQSLRINLIVAGDGAGTVHFWNLDDELRRKYNTTLYTGDSSEIDGLSTPSRSPMRSAHTSHSEVRSVSSPSVQLSAVECAIPVQKLTMRTKKKKGGKSSRQSTMASARQSPAHRGSIQLTDTSMHPSSTPSSATKSRASQLLNSSANKSIHLTTHEGLCSPRSMSKLQMLSLDHRTSQEYHRLSVVDTNAIMELQESPTHQRRSVLLKDTNTPPKSSKKKTPTRKVPTLSKAKGGGKASTAAAKEDPLRLSTGTSAPATAATHHADGDASTQKKRPRKSTTSVSPSRAKTPTKSTSGKTATHKTARKSVAKPEGESPSRLSTASPGRPSTREVSPHGSVSPSRNVSPSHARGEERGGAEYLPRTAMCRLEFTGGVAVTGMAIDTPPRIITTLRRIPNPEDKPRSLLEEPTPEEVERRVLENSFEMLTEEKALFFVMQYFQMYVAVEGAVLNVRFLPEWTAPDDDGRELFKTRPKRHQAASLVKARYMEREQAVDGKVDFATFGIRFKKLILDAHSQPVTQLYLDIRQRLVWVARNDGLLSLFSTESKQIVTQVAHPCAEAATGAPHYSEWRKQQVDFLTMMNDKNREGVVHLEWHPETLSYPPSHFFAFVPYLKKNHTTLLLTTVPAHAPQEGNGYEDSLFLNFGSLASSPNTAVWTVDTRSRNVDIQRNREASLSQLIEQLRWSRESADLIRRTQKEFYEATCDRVVKNVFSVMKELGAYNQLPILYKFMRIWRQRVLTFPRQHVMRQLRSKRLQRAAAVACALERAAQQKVRATYYVQWVRFTAQKRLRQSEELPQRLLKALTASTTRKLPTAHMMERLAQHYTRLNIFRGWQEWCRSVVSPSISVMRSMDRSVEPSVSRAGSPLVRTNTFRFRAYNSMKGSLGQTRQASPAGVMGGGPTNNFSTTQMNVEVTTTSRLDVLQRELHALWLARPYIMRFRESKSTDSVLDESWLSLVESSEASAATDDDLGRRIAVLRYGLLPLLQGLLATADDVLPTLNNPKVSDEVISMLTGIQLCLDYMVAEAESFLLDQHVSLHTDILTVPVPATRQSGRLSGSFRPSVELRASGLRGQYTSVVAPAGQAFPEDAAKRVLEVLIPLAMEGDQDSQEAVDEIVAATESFEAFLLFVSDEQVLNRRREASAGVI